VVFAYYLLPHKLRWISLLLASYFFYGFWKVEYLLLIAFSTSVDFFAAQFISGSKSQKRRIGGLVTSLATNLGLLFFFKYSGWFLEDVAQPAHLISENSLQWFQQRWEFILPVGISFYTFQTMSYTLDVFYGKVQPEKNPLKFALFVSFFPQLVAGPIERFSRLHHQLFQNVRFTYSNIQHGGRLVLYGLFIKMCVADNIAPIVDQIFENQFAASSVQLFWGMILFGLQIFSDFHGYSLIAIGASRLLGIELMHNFNSPYSSHSIQEFWTRWHISLSTWFRDYVFIPLGGSRVSASRLALNILIVFAVSGLWHGANWTFVAWGVMHGAAYLIEKLNPFRKQTQSWIRGTHWMITMAVVFVAWVFFRSDSVASASQYLTSMMSSKSNGIELNWNPMLVSFLGLFILSDRVFKFGDIHEWLQNQSTIKRWLVYSFLIYSILAFSGTINHPFIYFQF
jgi:alginate O-acetyltransferase complex protein AlgI